MWVSTMVGVSKGTVWLSGETVSRLPAISRRAFARSDAPARPGAVSASQRPASSRSDRFTLIESPIRICHSSRPSAGAGNKISPYPPATRTKAVFPREARSPTQGTLAFSEGFHPDFYQSWSGRVLHNLADLAQPRAPNGGVRAAR